MGPMAPENRALGPPKLLEFLDCLFRPTQNARALCWPALLVSPLYSCILCMFRAAARMLRGVVRSSAAAGLVSCASSSQTVAVGSPQACISADRTALPPAGQEWDPDHWRRACGAHEACCGPPPRSKQLHGPRAAPVCGAACGAQHCVVRGGCRAGHRGNLSVPG